MDKRRLHCRYVGGVQEKPSFSSALLDAIYRSIDENDTTSIIKHNVVRPCEPSKAGSITSQNQIRYASSEKGSQAIMNENALFRHHTFTSTASSYSDSSSSYSGFSSSDTDTVLRSTRISMPALIARSGPLLENKKSKGGSIGRKLRELRTRAPVSPGARLTSFLNALFTPRRTAKSDSTTASRPCLSKTGSLRERLPSGGSRRSVRFDPVSVECIHDSQELIPEALAPARKTQIKETVEEMLLRNFEDDDENDEAGSDSSSDLFELENLNAGIEAGRGYMGELPVFETTYIRRAPSMRF